MAKSSAIALRDSQYRPDKPVATASVSPENISDRPILSPPVNGGLFVQPTQVGPGRERDEQHNRDRFGAHLNYADPVTGNVRTYDDLGRYNCGRCNMQFSDDDCLLISIDVSLESGSCRHWEIKCAGDAEIKLTLVKLFTAQSADYGEEAPGPVPAYAAGRTGRGYGCWVCPYASDALHPDSRGRDMYCGKGDFRTMRTACCAANGRKVVAEYDGDKAVRK